MGENEGRFERVLVPTDGSETGEHALAVALDLARRLGSRITGLYVVDTSAYAAFPGDLEWETIRELLDKESEAALEALREACEESEVACDLQVREGHPAQVIIESSAEHDLVVMGTHGRSGLEHLLLGSVAEKVIRHAACPVLVVRTPGED